MDIDEIVILNITRLMKSRGLSQRELADNAKINYQNLNRLLKKKRSIYKSEVLPVLAAYFGVTVTELTKSNDEKPLVFYQSAIKTTPDRASRILALQSKLQGLSEDDFETVEMTIVNLEELSNRKMQKSKAD